MGYGNNKPAYGGNRNTSKPVAKQTQQAVQTDGNAERTEPVFTKLINLKTSEKGNLTFAIGKNAMTIPANTRVAVVALSEKRLAALQAAAKEKGYDSKVTHEIVAFPIQFEK